MRLAGCRVAMTIPATGNASSTTATAIAMTRSALPLPRLSGFLRSRVAQAVDDRHRPEDGGRGEDSPCHPHSRSAPCERSPAVNRAVHAAFSIFHRDRHGKRLLSGWRGQATTSAGCGSRRRCRRPPGAAATPAAAPIPASDHWNPE